MTIEKFLGISSFDCNEIIIWDREKWCAEFKGKLFEMLYLEPQKYTELMESEITHFEINFDGKL